MRQERTGRVSWLLLSSVVVVPVVPCAQGLCRRAAVLKSSRATVDAEYNGERRVKDRRAGVDAAWVVKRREEVGANDDGEQRQHGRRYDLECAKAKAQEHQNTGGGGPLFTLERAACALKAQQAAPRPDASAAAFFCLEWASLCLPALR